MGRNEGGEGGALEEGEAAGASRLPGGLEEDHGAGAAHAHSNGYTGRAPSVGCGERTGTEGKKDAAIERSGGLLVGSVPGTGPRQRVVRALERWAMGRKAGQHRGPVGRGRASQGQTPGKTDRSVAAPAHQRARRRSLQYSYSAAAERRL